MLEVESSSFTPLAFSCTGGAGPYASVTLKCLASKLSSKYSVTYSVMAGWLRCYVSLAYFVSDVCTTCLSLSLFEDEQVLRFSHFLAVLNQSFHTQFKSTLPQCYCSNEQEKRRTYGEHVREIECGSFSLLVLLISGGMGNTANYAQEASL